MIEKTSRERLNDLLEQLVPNRDKRKWLEVLELARQAETWRASQMEQQRLTPLPVVENLIGNPAALAKAKQSLRHMNPNSDMYLRLSRDVDQAESFMKGTPLFDEYLALLRSAA
jgi:hypothetical protein